MMNYRSLISRSLELKVLFPTILIQILMVGAFACLLYVLTSNQIFLKQKAIELEKIHTGTSKLTLLQDQIQVNLTNYIFDRSPQHIESITRDQVEIGNIVDQMDSSITDLKAKSYLLKYKESRRDASKLRNEIYVAVQTGNMEKVRQTYRKWGIVYEDISASLRDYANYANKIYERNARVYQDALLNLYSLLIVMIIGLITLSFWMYFYLKRIITIRISRLSHAASSIAHGNFEVDTGPASEDEIGQLSRDLRFMATRLRTYYEEMEMEVISKDREIRRSKELERRKDEFIGVASHELKTPLTSIKAYIQILERIISQKGDVQMKVYLEKTNLYIDRLNKLISDLLDVSKIHAGKMQFNVAEFPFDELVKESIDSVQPLTSNHTITLKGETGVMLAGDRERLEQVFVNLLTNAVKYSPASGEIEVMATNGGDSITVAVKDYGVGIPLRDQGKIFNRFYRVGKVEKKFSGLGIGLYIANEIVRRHGGKMWVDSEEGRGSTFYFSIPVTLSNRGATD